MDILIDFERRRPLFFSDPQSIICCTDPAACAESFEKIESALKAGYYVAGFLSYEAGYCFEERIRATKQYDFPLIQMGVYKQPRLSRFPAPAQGLGTVSDFSLNVSKKEYSSDIESIRGIRRRSTRSFCADSLFPIRHISRQTNSPSCRFHPRGS
jgi:para-aminobenzoate synthetase/4-amino-4-deoxychorismate lyase